MYKINPRLLIIKQAENGLQSRSSENGKTGVWHYGLILLFYLTGDTECPTKLFGYDLNLNPRLTAIFSLNLVLSHLYTFGLVTIHDLNFSLTIVDLSYSYRIYGLLVLLPLNL